MPSYAEGETHEYTDMYPRYAHAVVVALTCHLSPPPPCSMAKTASEEGFDEVLQLCSLLSLHPHLLRR